MANSKAPTLAKPDTTPKRLDFFERYLTIWVFACMILGVGIGTLFPGVTRVLGELEFGENSHVNIPIAVLIWLMIYPMMLKIDFGGISHDCCHALVLARPLANVTDFPHVIRNH